MNYIELSARQVTILEIVKNHGPITSERIADQLNLSRAALRPDLAILTMSGFLEARPKVGYYYSGKDPSDLIARIMGNIKIKEIQSRPVVVKEDCSVYDTIVNMFIEDVGTIFVVSSGGFLEGVVSRKDLLKASMGSKDITQLPVKVIMTRMPNIIVTTPDETVARAAQKLISHQVDALPVVELLTSNQEVRYQVVGRFTKTTLTRLFVQLITK